MYDSGQSPEAESLFSDLGVGGPGRGVLRDLFFDGERTAPELARRKMVTRQAAQAILDDLERQGFVRTKENPRHKRSKLYLLTPAGIEVCVKIRERELAAIRRMFEHVGSVDGAQFAAAAKVVARLSEALEGGLLLAAANEDESDFEAAPALPASTLDG